MTGTPSLAAAARWYAANGFRVFPVVPRGKAPITKNGFHNATTDLEEIEGWWAACPDANIGVATGPASDLAVLDVDGPAGEESLTRMLQDRGETLPPTRMVITGRPEGGFHFWLRFPEFEVTNSAKRLGIQPETYPDLQVRGTGGYVVAPPSVHESGQAYSWANTAALAPWPSWLRPPERSFPENGPLSATLSHGQERPKVTGRGNRYAEAALEGEAATVRSAPEGTRNEQLNASTHSIAKRFVPPLRATLVADTMLTAALAAGLPESEARGTIRSAIRAATEATS